MSLLGHSSRNSNSCVNPQPAPRTDPRSYCDHPFTLSLLSLSCLCSLPIKENHENRQLSTQCQTNCCVIAASQEQEKLNFIKINWRQHMSNIKPIQPNRPTPTKVLELQPYGPTHPPTSRLQFTSMSVQPHVCRQNGSCQCDKYDCTE